MKKIFLIISLILFFFSSIPHLVQAKLVPCGCVGYFKKGTEEVCCAEIKTDEQGNVITDEEGKVICKEEGTPCQFCHLFVLFKNIVDFLLFEIVPLLAILMIVIAGAMYILAYLEVVGDPKWISQAKSLIWSVVIGLILIYGAWLIVNLFFQIIGVEQWTGLGTWWEIKCP
ncbi:MAG: pilin [Patescibacteria group bacterium]|nr:pilin [Patescibacteria group bacterium]